MIYMGGKSRIAKHILPIMLKERKQGQCWVEPFVGGGGVIDKVENPRIGSDINQYTIDALISIRDHVNELPKNNQEFTADDYKKLMTDDTFKHKGFAGFTYSWGGKFLGGWSRNNSNRDYVNVAYKNAVKQSPKLAGAELICCSYDALDIPANSLIYCDPPYTNTQKYSFDIDHTKFWEWCEDCVENGHTVFVSEYTAPKGWECVWEKPIKNNLNRQYATECLFKKGE